MIKVIINGREYRVNNRIQKKVSNINQLVTEVKKENNLK